MASHTSHPEFILLIHIEASFKDYVQHLKEMPEPYWAKTNAYIKAPFCLPLSSHFGICSGRSQARVFPCTATWYPLTGDSTGWIWVLLRAKLVLYCLIKASSMQLSRHATVPTPFIKQKVSKDPIFLYDQCSDCSNDSLIPRCVWYLSVAFRFPPSSRKLKVYIVFSSHFISTTILWSS